MERFGSSYLLQKRSHKSGMSTGQAYIAEMSPFQRIYSERSCAQYWSQKPYNPFKLFLPVPKGTPESSMKPETRNMALPINHAVYEVPSTAEHSHTLHAKATRCTRISTLPRKRICSLSTHFSLLSTNGLLAVVTDRPTTNTQRHIQRPGTH